MKKAFVLVCVFCLAAFAVIKALPYFTHQSPSTVAIAVPSGPDKAAATPAEPVTPPAVSEKSLRIYTVAQGKTGDSNGLAPLRIESSSSHPASDALNALIASAPSPLPSGASLRTLTIKDGLATVDFSPEFKKNFHGSDTQEAQAVNSILLTLGQFSTVKRVQILVDGDIIDSLGGHFDISTPLNVIHPDDIRQAAANHHENHG